MRSTMSAAPREQRGTAAWIAWAWVGLLAALLFVQALSRARRPGGIDLTSYLLSARTLLEGSSPYLLATPFPYLYPATLALLLIPLTFVALPIALAIWFALNGAALWWSTRRVLIHVRPELATDPSRVVVFLAVFLTFLFTIVQSNLRNGQVNFIVVALCVAAALGGPAKAGHYVGPARPAHPALSGS